MKVIETMTMFDRYVHGYRPAENTRLHDQAGTLEELLHADTGFRPGRPRGPPRPREFAIALRGHNLIFR